MIQIFLQKYWTKAAGIIIGAVGGYLYYKYVGCVSGTCPLTSNPWSMIIYGSLMGMLLFDMIGIKAGKKQDNKSAKEDNEINN